MIGLERNMSMTRNFITSSLAAVFLASPALAVAQDATRTVTINGEVEAACTLGAPASALLNFGTLTGPDGRLTPALLSAAVSAETEIENAWCNTPSSLTLTASPLTLTQVPAYSSPVGFSRTITYNATLTDWSAPIVNRPITPGNAVTINAAGPVAADPLGIEFSQLTGLVNGSENVGAYIEAGNYSATVQITLAVN